MAAAEGRGRLGGAALAGRARRPRAAAAARVRVLHRGARLRRRRQHVLGRRRHGGTHDHRVGHRGPACAPPAQDPQRRARVVPAVQRAGRRVGPRWPVDQGRARRRRVGGDGPEGLDVRGALRGLGHAPGAHRPGRAQAQGHHLPHGPDGLARGGRAAVAPDRRRHPLQRGVPRRGPRAGVRHARPRRQRLGCRPDDARPRAGLDRRRRHVLLRAGRGARPGARGSDGPGAAPTPRRAAHPLRGCAPPRPAARCPAPRARS